MRYLIALCGLVITLNASATIYKHVEAGGKTTFSDVPLPGSEEVKLISTGAYDNNSTLGQTAANNENADNQKSQLVSNDTAKPTNTIAEYSQFSVASPGNKQVIQNQQQIQFDFQVKPELKQDDKIQLVIDGKANGMPTHATQFVINDLERGEHTVQALLQDAQGKLIKSTSIITFYVHRPTLFSPTRAQPVKPTPPPKKTN